AVETASADWAAETIAVVRLDDDRHAALLRQARDAAATLSTGLSDDQVSMGVSGLVDGVDGLSGALEEARQARRLAADRGGRVEVAGPEDLTSHVLLMAAVPAEVRRSYRARVLGPLSEYDRRHHSDLVATLERFLECEGSWTRCASELHLHVNTLRYRVKRIEQLTGRDLSRLADRVDLFLAMRLP
ncbi:MAG: PucR family transcriptional regulator, partial [Stackebrandtia sp.]